MSFEPLTPTLSPVGRGSAPTARPDCAYNPKDYALTEATHDRATRHLCLRRAQALRRGAPAARNAPLRAARHVFGARSEETRLNSSHQIISYAVFCLKKKKKKIKYMIRQTDKSMPS